MPNAPWLLIVICVLVSGSCVFGSGDDSDAATAVTEPSQVTATPMDSAIPTQEVATPTPSPTPEPSTATTSPEESIEALLGALPDSQRGCDATPLERWGDTPYGEAQGVVLQGDGELWVLVWRFEVDAPIQAGRDVKMVWRAGTGSLRVRAVDPAEGTVVGSVQGPDAHSDSNWDRPGSEWGTAMGFPHAGCWRVDAFATDWAAVLWFSVEP